MLNRRHLPALLFAVLLAACAESTVIDSPQGEDATLDERGELPPPGDTILAPQDVTDDEWCPPLAWFPDKDNDGAGTKEGSIHSCEPVAGYVAMSGDCDDEDVTRSPLLEEVCDGKDNDCNGEIDDGIDCGQCTPGETQPCGLWDVGECELGTRECIDGEWGPCEGEVPPQPEVCDGKDNDCDGEIDDGLDCSCEDGETQPCGETDIGECAFGYAECSDGVWGECVGAVTPQDETCDGKDNDCNGEVDDGLNCSCDDGDTEPCGESDVGECKLGTIACFDGEWGPCLGAVGPTDEVCDGLDNDCDGSTDEGCDCVNGETQVCGTNTGQCQQGTRTCTGGSWGPCLGEITPQPETCDGLDNDCDGSTDEGCDCLNGDTQSCGINTGECQAGTTTCTNGSWGPCVGEIKPVAEACDGLDNDCDGQTDETCDCLLGDTKPCGTDTGQCQKGTQTCVAGEWGPCAGEVTAKPEVCDGLDNDCDGQTDEGVKTTWYQDADSDGYGSAGQSTQACTPPQGYVPSSTDCNDADAGIHPGAAEVCDGKDNDCDGTVNEGNVCTNCTTSVTTGAKLCLVATYPLPGLYLQGVTWDSQTGHLWVLKIQEFMNPGSTPAMFRVTPDGEVVEQLPFPESFPKDITFNGDSLWATSLLSGKLYQFSLAGNLIGEFPMTNGELPNGIAWLGDSYRLLSNVSLGSTIFHLWHVSTDGAFSNPIDHSCVDTTTCFPNSLEARDGELWHCESGGSIVRRSLNWQELDRFDMKKKLMPDGTPIGIAWDGEVFWVTETVTGQLHKLVYVE